MDRGTQQDSHNRVDYCEQWLRQLHFKSPGFGSGIYKYVAYWFEFVLPVDPFFESLRARHTNEADCCKAIPPGRNLGRIVFIPVADRHSHLTAMNVNQNIALAPSLVVGLLLLTLPCSPIDASDSDSEGALMITNFSSDSPDLGWYVQNDNVMGGRSEGGFATKQEELIFAGTTNTNGGGFSSIRTRPFELDLSNYDGIQLRVKADGRRYTWQLQTNALWRRQRISYWADFGTTAGEWSAVNIPFSKFYPQFRGFELDGPELDPGQITELGLYIYDKKDGAFELRLNSIEAYSVDTPSTDAS